MYHCSKVEYRTALRTVSAGNCNVINCNVIDRLRCRPRHGVYVDHMSTHWQRQLHLCPRRLCYICLCPDHVHVVILVQIYDLQNTRIIMAYTMLHHKHCSILHVCVVASLMHLFSINRQTASFRKYILYIMSV